MCFPFLNAGFELFLRRSCSLVDLCMKIYGFTVKHSMNPISEFWIEYLFGSTILNCLVYNYTIVSV